jgi:hypothetical protein
LVSKRIWGSPPKNDENSAHDLDLDLDLEKEKENSFSFFPPNTQSIAPPSLVQAPFTGADPPKEPPPLQKPPPPAHGPSPPDSDPGGEPIKNREDATTIWNKARKFWNERELKPECRDLMIRPIDQDEILRTFRLYSWEEIRNAIGNYTWHKYKAGPEYRPPPPYGSLAGFLKNGVAKYFDDDALDQQFREEKS